VVHLAQVAKGTSKIKKKVHGGNDSGQSKPLGSCQLDDVDNPRPMRRREFRVGTWNVTGCRNREVELEDALKGYKLDVLGLSETWLKKGEEIAIPGFRWICVAGEKVSGKGGGIGFLVKDAIWESVGEVVEVSSRVLSMFLRIEKRNCWMIQVYAPINDAGQDEREKFWALLRDEVKLRKRSGQVIVIGDMNGGVGADPEDWDIVGQYGEEVINQNGESCLELCRGSGMVVMNGWFPHKRVHKMTYCQRMEGCNDREAILDYFCVAKEMKTAVVDVKVKRGVEIGSYHHLVLMKMDKAKFGHTPKRWRRNKWRWCLEKLKDEECRKAYQEKLKEKLADRECETVNEQWETLKKSILEAAEEGIGKKRSGGRGKKWWNEDIAKLVQLKKVAYRKWLGSRKPEDRKEFRDMCTKVKAAVKEGKGRAWEEFGEALQNDFYGNSRMFWKKVTGGRRQERVMLKNEKGDILEDGTEVAEWCKEYFQKLYNEGHEGEVEIIDEEREVSEGEDRSTEDELEYAPCKEEIRKSIERLKNGKAAGCSGIVGEMLKAGKEVLEEKLHSLFKRVWEDEVVPNDWECGIVIPLYKKGDKMDLDNYRGITLMDVTGKVFSGILRRRLERWYEGKIAEEQGGFRKGRGCVDQAYTLAQVMLKRLEMQKLTYLCFVDLKKAYDSVWREGLFRKLKQDGVTNKLVRLVRMWYRNVRARVRVNDEESEWFSTRVGVRQGDTLSPLLFNIFINGIVERVKEGDGGVRVGEVDVPILLFADDMVLMAEGELELEQLVGKVKEYCETWHLEVNVSKTKVMVVSKDGSHVARVRYGHKDMKYQYVHKCHYLGRFEVNIKGMR